jgi:hypothetical protein
MLTEKKQFVCVCVCMYVRTYVRTDDGGSMDL